MKKISIIVPAKPSDQMSFGPIGRGAFINWFRVKYRTVSYGHMYQTVEIIDPRFENETFLVGSGILTAYLPTDYPVQTLYPKAA